MKLFFTGREDFLPLFRLNPGVPSFKISVSATAISQDIESYVRASTRRRIADGLLVIQNPNLEDLIVQELVKGAKGMWVSPSFMPAFLPKQGVF
jgi:hypothetical protein